MLGYLYYKGKVCKGVTGTKEGSGGAECLKGRLSILGTDLRRTRAVGAHVRRRVSGLSIASARCSGGVSSLREQLSTRCSEVSRIRRAVARPGSRVCRLGGGRVSTSDVCKFLNTFGRICSRYASTRGGRFVRTFVRHVSVFPREQGSKG